MKKTMYSAMKTDHIALLFLIMVCPQGLNAMEVTSTVAETTSNKNEEDDALICAIIRATLTTTHNSQGSCAIPSNGFGRIIGKHMLRNEAIAFIVKQLTSRSKKLGSYCAQPFEVNEKFFGMRDKREKTSILGKFDTGKRIHTLRHTQIEAPYDSCYKTIPHPSGDVLVTLAGDLHAKIWETAHGDCMRTIVDEEPICDAQFLRLEDGEERLITQSSHWIKIWSLPTGLLLDTLSTPESEKISRMLVHNNTARVLIVYDGYYPTTQVWSLTSGTSLCTFKEEHFVCEAHFTPDGAFVITVCENASSVEDALRVWSATTGSLLDTYSLTWREICNISFDGTGKKMLVQYHCNEETSDEWEDVFVFRIKKGGKLSECYFDYAHGCAQQATFNTAGTLLLTASKHLAEIWRIKGKKRLQKLLGHKKQICSVSFNKYDDKALTSDSDGIILIWSVASGLCLHVLQSQGYAYFVRNAVISYGCGGAWIWFIQDFHNLFNGLTFDQAFLINALYEVVILKRLVLLREAASRCKALMEDEVITELTHQLSGSFAHAVKKIKKAGGGLLKKLSAPAEPIVTENNTILRREDVVFDFANKPATLLTAYKALPPQIRTAFAKYVREPL